jgi:hypothetical protein
VNNTLFASTHPDGPYIERPPGGDTRFVYGVGNSIQSIVTSTGVSGNGMSELSLPATGRDNGDRYLPFELTGCIATYTLELPKLQQFDYNTITDMVLHMSYTARDGGSTLRDSVETALATGLNNMLLEAERKGLYTCQSPTKLQHLQPLTLSVFHILP